MRVQVLNVGGRDARIAKRHFHATARTVGRGSRDVVGVARQAVAHDFGVNLRTAVKRVFELFEHEHARTFAHHEAVAILVEGTRRGLRIVVAARKRVHRIEGAHGERMNRRFATARDHHLRVAATDDVHGFADRMKPRRAGGDVRDVRALEILHDRKLPRGHVDDATRDHEGGNTTGAALAQRVVVRTNNGNAADARTDRHTRFRRELFGDFKLGVFECHETRGDAEVHEAVESTDFLHAQVGGRVEILHFAGNLATEDRSVEALDRIDPAHAGERVFPTRFQIVPDGRNHAEAGNDDTTIHS